MIKLNITEQEAPQRVDRFLLKYLNQAKKGDIFRLLRKKIVRINGKRVKENYQLQVGDTLALYLSDASFNELRKEPKKVSAKSVNLDIIYEDDDILLINKPAGILTHPDKFEYKNTLSTKVNIYLKHLVGKTFSPAPIQRLDKNTSGIVIFAKNYNSLKEYNKYMRERAIGKFYLTIVKGTIQKVGELKGVLTKDPVKNRVTIKKDGEGANIHTKYIPLESTNGFTLIEVELLTGRSHQIRATFDYLGFPIIGDRKYGGDKSFGRNHQLLHAYKTILPNGKEFISRSKEIDNLWKNIKTK